MTTCEVGIMQAQHLVDLKFHDSDLFVRLCDPIETAAVMRVDETVAAEDAVLNVKVS